MKKLRLPRWIDKVFLAVGLGLLIYVISRYPLDDLLGACRQLGPLVVLSPMIAVGWVLCNNQALWLLLDRRIGWWKLLAIRLTSDGYNALLPLAGMGGEPYRIKHISAVVPLDETLTAIIRDRVIENAVGLAYSALWLALALGRYPLETTVESGIVTFCVVGTAIAAGAILLVATSLPGKATARLTKLFGAPAHVTVRLPPGRFLHVAAWYVAARLVGTLEITTLMWLLDLPFDPMRDLFVYSMMQVAGFVGFAIPAGLGVYEGTSAYLFEILGYTGPQGVAFALARRARMLVVGLIGVTLHLIGAARDRRAAPTEPLE